jgi:hypothetical protein
VSKTPALISKARAASSVASSWIDPKETIADLAASSADLCFAVVRGIIEAHEQPAV